MRTLQAAALALLSTVPFACASVSGPSRKPPLPPDALARAAGVALTVPPYDAVQMEWKERIAQPYVYFEHHGAPADFGATMRSLLEFAVRKRIASNGAPFALFPESGAARACAPVAADPEQDGISFDELPKAMVAYAVVSGPYPQAHAAVSGLRRAMAKNGWEQRGPVRAIYLVNPAEAESYAALATELQIPWAVSP
jgi:effector-binding domain-containing protein